MSGVARIIYNGTTHGTAFFLGDRFALTACHCLADQGLARVTHPVVRLEFPNMDAVTAVAVDWDVDIDAAVLWIRDHVEINTRKVSLNGDKIANDTGFHALGYPAQVDDYRGSRGKPTTVAGSIAFFPDANSPKDRIQLSCREASAGTPLLLAGLSGAPVLIGEEEECIGIMSSNLSDSPERPAIGGICEAVPTALVLKKWPLLTRFAHRASRSTSLTNAWHRGDFAEQNEKTNHFVGRGEERARAIRHFGRPKTLDARASISDPSEAVPVPICAIHGPPGSGKTALAYQTVADLVGTKSSSLYANGWLSVNARGFDPDPGEPSRRAAQLRPEDVFLELLREVDPQAPNASVSALATSLRQQLGDREVLLLIDNVSSYQLIKELRRINSACGIIVTSRVRPPSDFTGLEQVLEIEVGGLSERDGIKLFTAGLNRDMDTRHVSQIVRLCDRLPLAIKMLQGILIDRPDWTAMDLLERFSTQPPLGIFESGHPDQPSLQQSFSLSYQLLDQRKMDDFCALGTLPPSGFSAWAAENLLPVTAGSRRLEYLANVHLLEQPHAASDEQTGSQPIAVRYQLHDLIWEYARDLLAKRPANDPIRRELVSGHRRLAAEYRSTAGYALQQFEHPTVLQKSPGIAPDVIRQIFQSPLKWLRAERPTMLANATWLAETDDHALVSEITLLLARLTEYLPVEARDHGQYSRALESGLKIARSLERRDAEAQYNLALGRLSNAASQYTEARDKLEMAKERFAQAGLRQGEAMARMLLGDALRELTDWSAAQQEFERARDIFADLGLERERLRVYPLLGRVLRYLGAWPRARLFFDEAVAGLQGEDSFDARRIRATALHDLGDLLRDQGELDEALARLQESEEIFAANDDELLRARVVSSYVDVFRDMRQWDQAARAFAICDPVFEKYADIRWRGRTQLNYAGIFRYQRRFPEARQETRTAQEQLSTIDDQKGHAMCDEALGVIELGLAEQDTTDRATHLAAAHQHLDQALNYFERVAEPLWTAKCQWGLARLYRAEGDVGESRRYAGQALAACDRLGAVPPDTYEPVGEQL